MSKMMPYMTDEEIMFELSHYDEQAFDDLPSWLRQELQVRRIPIPKRQPTEAEMWETVTDAKEHRIMNNELTLKDYIGKYTNKPLTIT